MCLRTHQATLAWIESYDPLGQNAVIWVKVPSIPGLGKTTIYLDYGSPSSVSPNGDAILIYLTTSILPSAWVKSGPVLTPHKRGEENDGTRSICALPVRALPCGTGTTLHGYATYQMVLDKIQ